MDNYKKAVLDILEIAINAPELNMENYDKEQVRNLNNAMIEIYQIAFSVPENSSNYNSALPLHDINCNYPTANDIWSIARTDDMMTFRKWYNKWFGNSR